MDHCHTCTLIGSGQTGLGSTFLLLWTPAPSPIAAGTVAAGIAYNPSPSPRPVKTVSRVETYSTQLTPSGQLISLRETDCITKLVPAWSDTAYTYDSAD